MVRLRDIAGTTLAERYGAWRSAIHAARGPGVTAEELYQGGYWSVVRSLPDVARCNGWTPNLWVTSAGYGMVAATTRLISYSATFSRGHVDSVTTPRVGADESEGWWKLLSSGRTAMGKSVASLAIGEPHATIAVIASPAYVAAMRKDLECAIAALRGRGSLIIVSSSVPRDSSCLEDCFVPSTSKLQPGLGGALTSLHARAMRHLINTVAPKAFRKENVPNMREKLEHVAEQKTPKQVREAMTDADVIAFIRGRLGTEGKVSHTRLLRELRESGRACEQGRFRRIFMQVTATK